MENPAIGIVFPISHVAFPVFSPASCEAGRFRVCWADALRLVVRMPCFCAKNKYFVRKIFIYMSFCK